MGRFGPTISALRIFAVAAAIFVVRAEAAIAPADKSPTKVDRPKVLVAEAKMVDDVRRILVPAKVEAKIQSTVTADIEAHVIQILKPLGASVKQGEVVMYLENRDPSFTYARVPVRSPVSGVLSQFLTTQMSKVARGDKLFTVINPKLIKICAEFSGSDAAVVRSGAIGAFTLNAAGSSTSKKVRVTGVSPLVDSRTGTASAELEFTDRDSAFPFIGSVGQVSLELVQGDVMLIPESSITYKDGKPMVRLVKPDGQVEKKSIELGEQRESLFVIRSGIKSGEKVVVRASRPIKDGETIEIEKSESSGI